LKKLIIKGMDKRYFSKKIVEWYLEHKRNLPWRDTTDPYKIWLSEIILQQTRVNQGLPYYEKFVSQYPTVNNLADAPEQQVLRLWQGLGYYTRARNLHKCAKKIKSEFQGRFPPFFDQLKSLPGIGDYTAAAIASFAFGESVAVVDGNVFRVLSRVYGIATAINSPAGKKEFAKLANYLIKKDAPAIYNQAIMEFGATFCIPVNPPCDKCLFKNGCQAYQHSLQGSLPVKLRSKASRKRYFHYLVFTRGKSMMMKRRDEKDIWFGLFDFPVIEKPKPAAIEKVLNEDREVMRLNIEKRVSVTETYKHILTHQTIYCKFVIIPWSDRLKSTIKGGEFYSLSKIAQLPKPALISRFLDDYSFYS
jgi:A/G-specific adenine glycosylase